MSFPYNALTIKQRNVPSGRKSYFLHFSMVGGVMGLRGGRAGGGRVRWWKGGWKGWLCMVRLEGGSVYGARWPDPALSGVAGHTLPSTLTSFNALQCIDITPTAFN